MDVRGLQGETGAEWVEQPLGFLESVTLTVQVVIEVPSSRQHS
jgi:hypothetical protein